MLAQTVLGSQLHAMSPHHVALRPSMENTAHIQHVQMVLEVEVEQKQNIF